MPKRTKQVKTIKIYQPPDPLPPGLIFEDIFKRKWKLGSSVDKGGCGEIYLTQKHPTTDENDYPYVMKIEYHKNSPLHSEFIFYCNQAQQKHVQDYKNQKHLPSLGISPYVSSGTPVYQNRDYRFVIMEKLGSNIEKIFNSSNRKFPNETVFQLATQILDALEYVHSRGYIHGDIKGSNILLGKDLEAKKQVYLVDFGLSARYSLHEKPDPRNANNGTMEYISRDGHLGIESRRGDLEILGYNMIHWLGCTLPWEKSLSDYEVVRKSKEKFMNNLDDFFNTCFVNSQPPDAVVKYMQYTTTLKFNDTPDYPTLKRILVSGVQEAGGSLDSEFKFDTTKTPVKRKLEKNSSASHKLDQNNAKRTKRSDYQKSDLEQNKSTNKKSEIRSKNSPKRSLRSRKLVTYF